MRHIAVIGLARFGTALAKTLASKGIEVLAIDVDEERVDDIADDVATAVKLDATDIKALRSQNVQDLDAVVVAIGSDFETLLLVTVNLMELEVPRIIARAMSETQQLILERMGITEIVSPETEVGINLAQRLVSPGILSYLELPDKFEIVEIAVPQHCENRTLADINLRKKYNINLIAIKRKEVTTVDGKEHTEEHLIGVPDGEMELHPTDSLLVIGKHADVERFRQVNR